MMPAAETSESTTHRPLTREAQSTCISIAALPLAHDFVGAICCAYFPFVWGFLVATAPSNSSSRFLFFAAGGAVIADEVLALITEPPLPLAREFGSERSTMAADMTRVCVVLR